MLLARGGDASVRVLADWLERESLRRWHFLSKHYASDECVLAHRWLANQRSGNIRRKRCPIREMCRVRFLDQDCFGWVLSGCEFTDTPACTRVKGRTAR